jgi:Flp pilus assembly protein TadD
LSRLKTLFAISVMLAMQLFAGVPRSFASDLKISLPRRNLSTPTQKLNREGVAELKHGHREKAKRLFYRAYLLDPQDPFTLNNLGYIAELEGDADRALRYYALATKEHTDAVIDESSDAQLKGKGLGDVYRHVQDSNHEVSKISEQAIVLFGEGRIFAARNLLLSALPSHPNDPFLLNNLGYAMESVGDLDSALRYYLAAASRHSTEPVVVTPRVRWRGRPVSEVAAANAAAVNEQIARGERLEAATARLNLRGVTALNDNRPQAAREFFLRAYQRDPQNAFTLNNLGYITELNGDWETAQFYYDAARSGRDASERVTYSTRRNVEGQKIDNLADQNMSNMKMTLKTAQEKRRRSIEPVELIPRNSPRNGTGSDAKPVPPVGIQAPPVPPLPPPGDEQNQVQLPQPSPQSPNSSPNPD